jgi:hypothetical protein
MRRSRRATTRSRRQRPSTTRAGGRTLTDEGRVLTLSHASEIRAERAASHPPAQSQPQGRGAGVVWFRVGCGLVGARGNWHGGGRGGVGAAMWAKRWAPWCVRGGTRGGGPGCVCEALGAGWVWVQQSVMRWVCPAAVQVQTSSVRRCAHLLEQQWVPAHWVSRVVLGPAVGAAEGDAVGTPGWAQGGGGGGWGRGHGGGRTTVAVGCAAIGAVVGEAVGAAAAVTRRESE